MYGFSRNLGRKTSVYGHTRFGLPFLLEPKNPQIQVFYSRSVTYVVLNIAYKQLWPPVLKLNYWGIFSKVDRKNPYGMYVPWLRVEIGWETIAFFIPGWQMIWFQVEIRSGDDRFFYSGSGGNLILGALDSVVVRCGGEGVRLPHRKYTGGRSNERSTLIRKNQCWLYSKSGRDLRYVHDLCNIRGRRKCPYKDFTSYVRRKSLREKKQECIL